MHIIKYMPHGMERQLHPMEFPLREGGRQGERERECEGGLFKKNMGHVTLGEKKSYSCDFMCIA